MSCPHIVHYIIPTVALIFGTVFLLLGVSTGSWIFYGVGGVVILLAGWGFNAAYRHIHRMEPPPLNPDHMDISHITVITDTGAVKIEHNDVNDVVLNTTPNPLQKVIPPQPTEDPAPPV